MAENLSRPLICNGRDGTFMYVAMHSFYHPGRTACTASMIWRRHRAVSQVMNPTRLTTLLLLRPWLAGARIRRLEALRYCMLR